MLIKNNKKTSIRKQLNKRFMLLIIGIFIIMNIVSFLSIQSILLSTVKQTVDGISSVMEYQMKQIDIEKLIDDGESSSGYALLDKALDYLTSKQKGIIDDVFIISKQDDGKWAYIIDKAKENPAKLGDVMENSTDDELKNQAIETKQMTISKGDSNIKNRTTDISVYIPIDTKQGINTLMCFTFKTNIIIEALINILVWFVIILILSLIIIRIIVGRITRRQTASIDKLVDKMKDMAELDGDLTHRIEINSNDEIGELAYYTNKMLDTINDILIKVNNTSKQLTNTSNEFEMILNKAINDFDKMNTLVDDITNRIDNQTSDLFVVNENISMISEAVSNVAENSQSVTAQAVNTSTNAIEGNKVMISLKDQSEGIVEVVNETSDLIDSLSEKSVAINSIADTINSISEQTNLLALNASIEAARAGEYGRGFVVVAEEVRKLAEESSKSAKEIFHLIQEVQNGIMNAGESMENVTKKSIEGNQYVIEVTDRFNEIVNSISEVSNMVEEVSSATEEMSAGAMTVASKMGTLTDISEENNAAANDVSAVINDQTEEVRKLSEMMTSLNIYAEELSNRLSKLKLE